MKSLWWIWVVGLLLLGCGGGGGGGVTSVQLTGLVENITNGGAPSPAASVQVGSTSVNTGSDGSFTITAPPGTDFVLVVYTPSGGSPLTFRFDFAPATEDKDLGRLIVGPQQVTVTGAIRNQSDNSAISGATVTLGGVRALTASNGVYSLLNVAYDPGAASTFFNLEGRAGKAGFFPRIYYPDNAPIGGVASISDVFLQPDSGTAPPGTPYNLEGFVNPTPDGVGAVVELRQGATVVRRMTTGSDRRYAFWVAPGNYMVIATKGTLTSGLVPVTLSSPADTVRRDVTLN